MALADYMAGVGARLGVGVFAVRFPDARSAQGPALLWRMNGRAGPDTIDISSGIPVVEIQCRAPTYDGVQALRSDVLAALGADGALRRVVDEFDEPDSGSGERGAYFASVIEAEVAPPG